MLNITIGVPSYNRKDTITQMSKSFYNSDLSGANIHLKIYDDCSTDFDREFLKSIFPTATQITVNTENLKADKNTFSMYKDFLNSEDDYFFNADSDIIFHKDWLNFLLKNIEDTDGMLSIYNSSLHKSFDNHSTNKDLLIKKDIGAAGTMFSRKIIELIVNNLTAEQITSVDWSFCDLLYQNNLKIYCSKNSYVQHIGLMGQNSKINLFEYAENFEVDSVLNGQILNDILLYTLPLISFSHTNEINKLKKSKNYKTGKYILAPAKFIKKLFNKIVEKKQKL